MKDICHHCGTEHDPFKTKPLFYKPAKDNPNFTQPCKTCMTPMPIRNIPINLLKREVA